MMTELMKRLSPQKKKQATEASTNDNEQVLLGISNPLENDGLAAHLNCEDSNHPTRALEDKTTINNDNQAATAAADLNLDAMTLPSELVHMLQKRTSRDMYELKLIDDVIQKPSAATDNQQPSDSTTAALVGIGVLFPSTVSTPNEQIMAENNVATTSSSVGMMTGNKVCLIVAKTVIVFNCTLLLRFPHRPLRNISYL